MKKLDSFCVLFKNDKRTVRVFERREDSIIFKYKNIVVRAFLDKKAYEEYLKENINKKFTYDVVTFFTTEEFIEFLKEV